MSPDLPVVVVAVVDVEVVLVVVVVVVVVIVVVVVVVSSARNKIYMLHFWKKVNCVKYNVQSINCKV